MSEQTQGTVNEPSAEQTALALRAQSGEAHAFTQLTASYYAAVYRLCLGYARNAADAEDLTQETFLKAHRQLAQLKQPQRFGAWLMQIAANTCRNWVHRERPRQMVSLETLETTRSQDMSGNSETQQAARERTVQEALARLPVELRRTVQLVYLDGLTQNELAVLWHVPHSTIKGRLDSARRLLRKELQSMGFTPEQTMSATEITAPDATVAIVDTDKQETRELRAAIKTAGLTCSVIANGSLVLAHLRRHKSDILIVNSAPGSLDRHELLRALRQDVYLRDRAVIFLVPKEDATEADIFRAWTAGVDCYLTKPVTAQDIRAFVLRMNASRKATAYCTLAIEHAWRQDTPSVLHCLQQAQDLEKDALGNVRDDPSFNYLRHLPEFQQIMQGVMTPHEQAAKFEAKKQREE